MNSTAQVLQTLRGGRLHVLIALFAQAVLPVGERPIAAMCGVSRKTVRAHLQTLEALGLVVHGEFKSKATWNLTVAARQLPLPFAVVSDGRIRGAHESLAPLPGLLPGSLQAARSPLVVDGTTGSYPQGYPQVEGGDEGKSYPHGPGEGKSYPHGDTYLNVVVDQVNLKDQQQRVLSSGEGKSYPHGLMWAVLEWLEVERPESLPQVAPALALAYAWYALAEEKIERPAGYVITRIVRGDSSPPGDWLTLARAWLALDDDRRRVVLEQWRQASIYGFDLPSGFPWLPFGVLKALASVKRKRLERVTGNGLFAPDCLLPEEWRME
jgi:hypothetical protein